jgi:hypothetical protein
LQKPQIDGPDFGSAPPIFDSGAGSFATGGTSIGVADFFSSVIFTPFGFRFPSILRDTYHIFE